MQAWHLQAVFSIEQQRLVEGCKEVASSFPRIGKLGDKVGGSEPADSLGSQLILFSCQAWSELPNVGHQPGMS